MWRIFEKFYFFWQCDITYDFFLHTYYILLLSLRLTFIIINLVFHLRKLKKVIWCLMSAGGNPERRQTLCWTNTVELGEKNLRLGWMKINTWYSCWSLNVEINVWPLIKHRIPKFFIPNPRKVMHKLPTVRFDSSRVKFLFCVVWFDAQSVERELWRLSEVENERN